MVKIFVFDPLWDQLLTPALKSKLDDSKLEVIVETQAGLLADCSELFEGEEDRILCINPDYVGWKLDAADYQAIPNLKAILIASTAFSWVDLSYANEADIPVCNIRHFSTEAVAEWATMMMLNLARQTPLLIKDEFPLNFDTDYMKYRGLELKGKTVGIVGLGHNGEAIAERCLGLGMEVIYWSRSSSSDKFQRVELDELMSIADVIIPAFAKDNDTALIMSEPRLRLVKPSAIVIDIIGLNAIRSLILDRVESGDLFGYGFEADPTSFNMYKGNVWAAPAYAWATDGSMSRCMEKWLDNMVSASAYEYPMQIN